jgi:transcriptional regulator with XRE-family HTH domain
MAKSIQKLEAQKLRKQGWSIKDVAEKLIIAKSTVSIWCRDIKLTKKQIARLLRSKQKKITRGRLKGAQVQKMKRLEAIKLATQEASMKLKALTDGEFFIAGLALYLAEGSRNMGRVHFTNSNPRIIKFVLRWFKKFYHASKNDMRYSVTINLIHKKREGKIKKFWQRYLKIRSSQFTPFRYTNIVQKKIYANYDNYFGTFSFRINKSTHLLYRLKALMNRLLVV